jgi:hypothetical protein
MVAINLVSIVASTVPATCCRDSQLCCEVRSNMADNVAAFKNRVLLVQTCLYGTELAASAWMSKD